MGSVARPGVYPVFSHDHLDLATLVHAAGGLTDQAVGNLRIIRQGHEGWLLGDAKVLHHTPEKDLGSRRLFKWQAGIGRMWAAERGRPTPGKFGVAWWAWREYFRRRARMLVRWRPWPSRSYYDALVEAAQYWGYLRS